MNAIRRTIHQQVSQVKPFDKQEIADQQDVLTWLDSETPVFRTAKPATPPKHLVSYFVLFDELAQAVLLVQHRKAKTWLTPGGHVDVDEDPKAAALREAHEELGVRASFWQGREEPYFVTVTKTINETADQTHTDVSLWYILEGNKSMRLDWDHTEFTEVQWASLRSVVDDKTYYSPLRRFCEKLLDNEQ